MQKKIASCIATVGYVGYLPKAPGTWGSLVAFPIYDLSRLWGVQSTLLFFGIFMLFVVGWAATYILLKDDPLDKDPAYVVVDELYAMLLVFVCLPPQLCSVWGVIVAFFLFRVFDIIKPWPIDAVDTYFKRQGAPLASFGVMIDDLLAALYVLGLVWGASILFFGR